MKTNYDTLLEVRVWADYACFTRPEMKVERVSYPVMTPSAARGVLEAIFWKPEIYWVVKEIWILKPIRYFSIVRKEAKNRISLRTVKNWEEHGGGYDIIQDHTLRHTLGLRDVAYLIRAEVEGKPYMTQDIAKYRDQFRRRVKAGRCFNTPYLGCREFSAFFGEGVAGEKPIVLTENLGMMLHSMNYLPDSSGRAKPQFFEAELRNGILSVPNSSIKES